jgi:imidazolonepropionase-like amidohydrolase
MQMSGSLALVNGTVIDGTGADSIPDGVVVIDGERIVAVGTSGEVLVSPDTPTVDVQGATMLPGFVNAHVHMAYNKERLAAWAQAGVTTVRDLGAWLWPDGASTSPRPDLCPTGCSTPSELFVFRDQVAGDPAYARLIAAGPIISLPRGLQRESWLAVTSPEEAEPTVAALIEDGAEIVKVYIEENAKADVPTQDALNAIVETAHARGVPVAAHVLRSVHVPYALEAGVDDLAHMVMVTLEDDLLTRVIDDGLYWVPTLEVFATCDVGDRTPQVIDNLRKFSQAGGNVALGTDYIDVELHPDWAISPTCSHDLGMPMTEIELMLEADMTPMQIIVAATRNGAHVCGLEDEIGTLEAGKIADILIVEGDPLDDMHALTDVQMVIHNGVVIREE